MQNILEIQGLEKQYPGFSLGPIDLVLPAGCIMGFIGENGAGKTTTINLILGLIKKNAGCIKLFGQQDYLKDRAVFEKIGVVLADPGLHTTLNAKEIHNIMRRTYKSWDSDQYWQYIKQFRLPEKKKVGEYSQGMQRKLSLAVALSHGAKLLILDEATSGLDPIVRDELLDVFLAFIQDESNSIFLSSHILSDLEKACDYIALLHGGRMIFSEPKDELMERFGVFKGTEEALRTIDPTRVHGVRRHAYGLEALVERQYLPGGLLADPARIEDIMLFYIKGE